jgi:hypothetical protein
VPSTRLEMGALAGQAVPGRQGFGRPRAGPHDPLNAQGPHPLSAIRPESALYGIRGCITPGRAANCGITLVAVQAHTPLAFLMDGGLGMDGMNPSEVARRHTSMRPPSQSARDVHPIIRSHIKEST